MSVDIKEFHNQIEFTNNRNRYYIYVTKKLNIKCERKEKKDTFSYSETSNFNYERSFYIPDNANENKIKAKSNNGVLLIEISKLKKVKKNSKKIEIS